MLDNSLEYYKNLEYNIIIERKTDEDDVLYIAYCNEFGQNACYGIGNTREIAMNSFIEQKDYFIDFLYEKGELIPEPVRTSGSLYSGVFTVRTSPWLHSLLINQSRNSGLSLNAYINQTLSFAAGINVANENIEKKIQSMEHNLRRCFDTMTEQINTISYSFDHMKSSQMKSRFEHGLYKAVG